MSAEETHSLRAGVFWPRIPAHALISRDGADTRIPAVQRLSAAHHSLSAMPAARVLLACSPVCWHKIPACAGVYMRLSSWPSLVMRCPPQPSERVIICHAANCYKYRDHTPKFLIDDWSLMVEPVTEMDVMDSAKDSKGLDLGLSKAMASGLGWIEVKTIVQEPVVNPLGARFYRSDLIFERRQVCTYIIYSWMSSAYWWGSISRNLHHLTLAYISYIRPLLEYASPAWSPSLIYLNQYNEHTQNAFLASIN